ncbi:MAG: hypothetical protein HYY96_15075 [Candidatus Tectomicrobia bacterium]|nr:hypothetical protein [Candidatus Tectomicrobia bacterium]
MERQAGAAMVASPPQHFSNEQLGLIASLTDVAEEAIAGHYKIGMKEWRHCRYDIRTQRDEAQPPQATEAFAEVSRYECVALPDSRQARRFDLYRIRIYDAAILHALHNRQALHEFEPLLLYILTHELVHVVRFGRMNQAFWVSPKERQAEEARVHKVTHDILRALAFQRLPSILNHYAGFCALPALPARKGLGKAGP